jgi:deoxyribodipyrimidine photo-lyase
VKRLLTVVWFKRDLRVYDHPPLYEAAKRGLVLPLYVAEPSIWKSDDLSKRHFQFVIESLIELSEKIEKRGGKLYSAIGEMTDVLQAIYDFYGPFQLFAHEENGTSITFARDEKVRQWMKERGLIFKEWQHFGVKRGSPSQHSFQKQWKAHMEKDMVPAPEKIISPPDVPHILSSLDKLQLFRVNGEPIAFGQEGGESKAHETLESFLQSRHKNYTEHFLKPLQASGSCSRLSPYLAWGNISMRLVVQKTKQAIQHAEDDQSKKSLKEFFSNLQKHCRLIQLIEDLPDMDTVSIEPALDELRREWNDEWFEKWLSGTTGYPQIDSVMKCLQKTGWIDYHSRAMLISFACNTLLLDWKRPAKALARLLLDFEPGIHYSQVQMVAGTTGKNTSIRIYDPVKHGKRNDPDGEFIKRYIPELRKLDKEWIHEPWRSLQFFSLDYPAPIIDVTKANRYAKQMFSLHSRITDSKTANNKQSNFEQLQFHI